jgi:hypothetical protein
VPATLSFTKALANDTIVFTGTKVNPGFQASALYTLQVDTTGDNFNNPTTLASGISDSAFVFTISGFNATLLNRWLPYVPTSLDFRIVAVLDHSNASTTVPVIQSVSPTKTLVFTLYGLPQFNLIGGSGMLANQYIQSSGSNNVYSGLVKLDSAVAFTLTNPVTGTKYGYSGGKLSLNSTTGYAVNKTGWYLLTIDTVALTITPVPNMIGMYGDGFTSSTGIIVNWNTPATPDLKMDYNTRGGFWYTTVIFTTSSAQFKFRENDSWGSPPSGANIGCVSGSTSYTNIYNNGSSGNINAPGTGKWYITLTIASGGNPVSCTVTQVP